MTFKIGDEVSYHSIIGGPATSHCHMITAIEFAPNNYGCDVAWISGKIGCVAMQALSNKQNPPFEKPKPLSRSQERYRKYLQSECNEKFGEWLKNGWYKEAL